MGAKGFKGAAKKRDGGRFLALPWDVLESRAYLVLSPYAVKLLIDLAAQYRGNNNGDLGMAWKIMRPRGWRSEETLHKAKRELLKAGLIFETRKGARPNKASLYGLTFFDLDYCKGKLDITAQGFPRGAWRLLDPVPPLNPTKGPLRRTQKNADVAMPGVVVAE